MDCCVECEVRGYYRYQLLLHQYGFFCRKYLGLLKPPRESLNRWIMDIFATASTNVSQFIGFPLKNPLFPEVFSELHKTLTWRRKEDFCQRVASRGLSSNLFYELIDELPFPVDLSASKKHSSVLKTRTRTWTNGRLVKKRKIDTFSCLSSTVWRGNLLTTHYEEANIDTFDSIAKQTAAAIIYLVKCVEPCRDKSLIDYLTNLLYPDRPTFHFAHLHEWATNVLNSEHPYNQHHLDSSVFERKWFQDLKDLCPDLITTKPSHEKPSVNDNSAIKASKTSCTEGSCIPLIICVLFSLRSLKKRLVIEILGDNVATTCCELETFLLNLFFTHKKSNVSLPISKMSNDFVKELVDCSACLRIDTGSETNGGLCGLRLATKAPQSAKAIEKRISPQILKKMLQTDTTDYNQSCVRILWFLDASNIFVCVSVVLDVLQTLYDRFSKNYLLSKQVHEEQLVDIFLNYTVRMLLRYTTVSGLGKQGQGLQASITSNLWKVLKKHLEVEIECFASPLNATLPCYFSMFPNIDQYFGSKGSFFHMYHTIEEGSYQLNPPFVESVLERVVKCILFLLNRSEQTLPQKPLSFFCVVPNWDNAEGCYFLKLLQNTTKFLVTQIVLKPQHHFFTSSSQKAFVEVLSLDQLHKHCLTPYPLQFFPQLLEQTYPTQENTLMTSSTPIHLQPRWRFNYRFDAANTEEYSNVPTSEQIKNLYMKSGVSISQPRQIPFFSTPMQEPSNYIAKPSDSVFNNRQNVVIDYPKETQKLEHVKIKQMDNPNIQNINNEWNPQKTNVQQEDSYQNSLVEKKYQCIERLNSKTSPNLSVNSFVSTTIPSINRKEIMLNSDSYHERHVILPGGMYANLSDVYVESLPNYTEGDEGSRLVMSLSNVLKKSDMLEKYYFSLMEENRQLQSMIETLTKQIPSKPVSLASTTCETTMQDTPNTKKKVDAMYEMNSLTTATMKKESLKQAKSVQNSLPPKKSTTVPSSSNCKRVPAKNGSINSKVTRPKASSTPSTLSKHTSKLKHAYKKF